ncbi:conserved hypothetical protein [Candidatus Roizmanbacteria bacterium]|nr:conserved hypothetical protein [Candidatus Roizmanbacteria bacterium]
MKKLNLNQKKVIADVFVNTSVANISISIVTPIIYKFLFDKDLLISIFIILIISVLMILFSIDLMKK